MNDQPKSTLADKISQEIKQQKIHMRSKTYFVLGSLALGVGLAGVFLITMFFIGIIFFRLRVNAPFDYLRPGLSGVSPFIQNLPWTPLIIAVVGVVLGIWLMRKYEFSYKKAWKGIVVGLIGAVLVTGFVVDATGLPDKARDVKGLRSIIEHKFAGDNWVAGRVIMVSEESLEVTQPDGIIVTIHLTDATSYHPPELVEVDEFIRVIGSQDNNMYVAENIIHGQSPRGLRYRDLNVSDHNYGPGAYYKMK